MATPILASNLSPGVTDRQSPSGLPPTFLGLGRCPPSPGPSQVSCGEGRASLPGAAAPTTCGDVWPSLALPVTNSQANHKGIAVNR